MAIRFHDPRGQVGTPLDPYELAADWSGRTPSIGLLANGFPDSVAFLEQIQGVLAERLPEARTALWNKGDASSLAGDDLLSIISAEVEAVITAYGH
jgi:hypothetical protein